MHDDFSVRPADASLQANGVAAPGKAYKDFK